jgi:subtilisin family serine protease
MWSAMVRSLAAVVLALMVSAAAIAGDRGRRALVEPTSPEQIVAIAQSHGARVLRQLRGTGYFVVEAEDNRDSATLVQGLAADSRVQSAEPSTWVTIPEIRGDQLAFAFDVSADPMGYTNQQAFSQVRLPGAHQWATGRGTVVAVLDTGVNVFHPDLAGRCLPGYNALNPALPPLDLPDGPDAEVSIMGIPNAGVGHGTMVAGVISVVAPDTMILPVKVLAADGSGTVEDVVEGILWAVQAGADVINMSFGSPGTSEVVEKAVKAARRAGVVVVASAGNDNNDIPHIPAAYNSVISVSSVESDNVKSSYASYGTTVDLVAPGTGIRSTYWDGGYASWSGTSFAAPFVSGAAALLRELMPQVSPRRIAVVLGQTATSVDSWNPDYAGLLGNGLLNIRKAVRRADD